MFFAFVKAEIFPRAEETGGAIPFFVIWYVI